MQSLILLNEADQSRLDSIIRRNAPPPHPDSDQTELLRGLLSIARDLTEKDSLLTHVELGDLVTVISPLDVQDYYKFRIVMPDAADVDRDHISICTPIGAAVLGRPVGELVEWQTPAGPRRMRIIAIGKDDT